MLTKSDAHTTGLASESYVLSVLYRLRAAPTLTLGNQKAIDIVIIRRDGTLATIDVKGTAGGGAWFAPRKPKVSAEHYFIFVDFCGTTVSANKVPDVFVVPSSYIETVTSKHPGGKSTVQKARLKQFEGAWELLQIQAKSSDASVKTITFHDEIPLTFV